MTHFAELDENNIVLRVIVAEQGFIDSGAVGDPSKWVKTSYTGKIRKNYAGIGYGYDHGRDAFIPPKPYESWILDEETARYKAPKPEPNDGKSHVWNENIPDWVEQP
jgi:hypothetical protein